MANKTGLYVRDEKWKKYVKNMTDRVNNTIIFFKKVSVSQYKAFQLKRWQTENASEGGKWKPLDPNYAERKKKLYKDYPKGGRQMLIATSNLFQNTAINPTVLAFPRKLIIAVNQDKVGYAPYVNEERPFMKFSKSSIDKFREALKLYLKEGKFKIIK